MAFVRGTATKTSFGTESKTQATKQTSSEEGVKANKQSSEDEVKANKQSSEEGVKTNKQRSEGGVKAKKWVLVNAFDGEPKDSDIELQEEELKPLKENEILCEAVYLSVDPYMRGYMSRMPPRSTMIGQQLAKVTESKNKDWPVGTHVLGQFGWRTHTVVDPSVKVPGVPVLLRMPDIGNLPKSLTLGTLGMPGVTANFGFNKLCQPKSGDVVLVNAAAGAVGHVVGQIAKIKGCRVVGCAGSDAKCAWLKDELGFDHVFNYKKVDLDAALKEAAPDGFDCYFDNVGGNFTATVLGSHMKLFGRVAICGAISEYSSTVQNKPTGPYPWRNILFSQLQVSGFIVTRWWNEWDSAMADLSQWVKQGKIKYREHVTEGFGNMRQAFYGMLKGDNTGKSIVKV